jgi:exo-beta-1,3-glucanase (GH17 family)
VASGGFDADEPDQFSNCAALRAGFPAVRTTNIIFSGRQAVNIMLSVSSIFASSRRLVSLGLCLGLAACGSSQNWEDNSQFVTVGVSVTGFTGGSLALWNNGTDRITIPGNGAFKFPLKIARGSNYAVVVATQPADQTCTVTNGIGTANGDAFDATVKCVPYTFTRRPLPAIYTTGQAVNYSPYRTATGPIDGEVPSDLDILQDLTLLDRAGFNLLRLFGARAPATDVVAEKILRIAAQTFPDMKFQLGVELKGLVSCSQTDNDFNIAYLISNLSKYPNVVTISVGNETSFFSRYMPLPCLEGYIRTIRAQVTQPVTTDDDWTFYAGKATSTTSERVPVKPDTILPLIDFASIHMYPISYPVWDWQQTSVPAGPERAQAMMEQSLVALKEWHGEVVNYQYVGADGVTVSVGDSMPISVGETGWKARQTNPASKIESFAALEVNQKWYFDLLYGNPDGYESWQGSASGPPMIFYFEAFDETWKGIDDGWGLWNIDRQARYALCGTPAGPACNDDLYAGAGYYVSDAGLIYADDYVGTLPATSKSAQGGDVGFFVDPRFALGTTATYEFGGVVSSAQNPGGVPNFYYGLGLNLPAISDAYFVGYVNAPDNGTVDVTPFANIRLNFWGPPELFERTNFTPAIEVILAGPTVVGCGSNTGRSEVQTIIAAAQKNGAASLYTLPLNGFTLKFACSGETTVAQVLANVAQVNINLVGTSIQYVNRDPDGVAYPNGLNIGPITFQ